MHQHRTGPDRFGGSDNTGFGYGERPRQPVFNAPSVVLWLIGLLAVAHFLRVSMAPRDAIRLLIEFGFLPARVTQGDDAFARLPDGSSIFFVPDPLGGVMTFVSHALLHGDAMHLIFNCVWLLAFGAPVARRIGDLRFAGLFVASAIAGAALFLLFNPQGQIPVVGASGAIAGLMGAATRFMFAEPRMAFLRWGRPANPPLTALTDQRVLGFAGVFVLINVLMGFIGLGFGGQAMMIAWEAHLGGFFAGLFLMPLFDRR